MSTEKVNSQILYTKQAFKMLYIVKNSFSLKISYALRFLKLFLVFYSFTLAQDLSAFGSNKWGTNFDQVREEMKDLSISKNPEEKTNILNIVKNKLILIKRNGILYRYNFYRAPYEVARLKDKDIGSKEKYSEEKEAVLFHVQLTMPMVKTSLIQKRLIKKYGNSQNSTLDETGQGAEIWNIEEGIIVLWHEAYSDESFTQKIDYMSTKYKKQINKDFSNFFDASQKRLVKEFKVY